MKAKPTRSLPTDRIAFPKQLDILRAFAAASGQSGKGVTNSEVAAIVNMKSETVSLGNGFLLDIGLLSRGEGGIIPSQEVFAFQRGYEWNPETAANKLAPKIAQTWFAAALLPRLSFRPLEEDAAIQVLADAASAGPDYKGQLGICIEYLIAAGIVQRDGTLLKTVKGAAVTVPATPEMSNGGGQPKPTAGGASAVTTGFTQPSPGGAVQFNVAVSVDMAEFAEWKPERIVAFFNGIAAVLAAKAAIEKEAAK
jgi:hypothetical protein